MRRVLLLGSMWLGACTEDGTDPLSLGDPAPCGGTEQIGATEASHSKAPANYDILMGDGEVPRLDIVICDSDFGIMSDDLADLLDGVAGGAGGPGGGGPGGPGAPTDMADDSFSDEDPIYVPVTLAYDGQVWPQVGMRYKGNSSLYSAAGQGVAKLPFRLSIDHYEDEYPELENQRFYGFKDLKFSSGYNDSTLQRDKLTADLFRAADVPAARGGFVRIYIDTGDGPVYWGLYTAFEDPAGELLDSWFGDDSGNAYKPDGDAATLASFTEADFEKKTNDDEADFSDVQALVDALNDNQSDPASWRMALEETFNIDGFIRQLAVNNLAGNWDTYGRMTHNYYLYGDPTDGGRLTWIPWDFNEAHSEGMANRAAIDIAMSNLDAGWPLLDAVDTDPVYWAQYEDEVSDVVAGAFSAEEHDTRIVANQARIAEWAAAETAPFTNQTANFLVSSTALLQYVQDQRDEASELGL